MVYYCMDWRVGLRRQTVFFSIDDLRTRFGGTFPASIRNNWEALVHFAGAGRMQLPSSFKIAGKIGKYHALYPSLDWLEEQYQKMVNRYNLVGPPEVAEVPPCQPSTPSSSLRTSLPTSTGTNSAPSSALERLTSLLTH